MLHLPPVSRKGGKAQPIHVLNSLRHLKNGVKKTECAAVKAKNMSESEGRVHFLPSAAEKNTYLY